MSDIEHCVHNLCFNGEISTDSHALGCPMDDRYVENIQTLHQVRTINLTGSDFRVGFTIAVISQILITIYKVQNTLV